MKDNKVTNVVIAGLGGQGVLKASDILSRAIFDQGLDLKKSEIHGMSQRGGSVSSHIVFSEEEVYAPSISKGEADILVAFEEMEANRWIEYLKTGGKVVINDFQIHFHNIAAHGIADSPGGCRVLNFTHVARIHKVIEHFVTVLHSLSSSSLLIAMSKPLYRIRMITAPDHALITHEDQP